MPQCPHCKTHYELGQQYCDTCESYLLHPEEGDTFCPQCGIRVSPRQEICHKCDAPLPASEVARAIAVGGPGSEAPPAPSEPPPETPPTPPPKEPATSAAPTAMPIMPSWVMGSLVGGGLIILALAIIVVILLTRTPPSPTPAPPPLSEVKPPPATVPPAPSPDTPAPEVSLKDQLARVLENLKEAQLRQDIFLYMSCYSYIYPSLDNRRQTTLAAWGNYRYTNLSFFIDEVRSRGPDNAIAQVTWDIQVQDRRTQETKNLTQTYRVGFARELGRWRIRSLEELEEGGK